MDDNIGSVYSYPHEEGYIIIVRGGHTRSYPFSTVIEQKIEETVREISRKPCPECPHLQHENIPCQEYVKLLDNTCGCGYAVEEAGQETAEGGYDQWNLTDLTSLPIL